MKVQKVLNGLRISLSAEWCKRYNIKEGDIVLIDDETKYLRIIPAEVKPKG